MACSVVRLPGQIIGECSNSSIGLILSNLTFSNNFSKMRLNLLATYVVIVCGVLADWVLGYTWGTAGEGTVETRRRDIFLGGTCGKTTWRDDTAIPILR